MKAAVYSEYGSADVVSIEEVAVPSVGEGQVLVRVVAASVNPVDWHDVTGTPYIVRLFSGLRRPKARRLGTDLAGVIEQLGPGVTGFTVGDAVFGQSTATFAEFAVVSEQGLVLKPESVSFESAAAVGVAATTALQGLRLGGIRPGMRVLVIGASGGVGTWAVQLATHGGAQVTGVCGPHNLELVRSLGAARAIDYTAGEVTSELDHYDIVFELAGQRPLRVLRRLLAPGGTLVRAGLPKGDWLGPVLGPLQSRIVSLFSRQRLLTLYSRRDQAILQELADLLAAGEVQPVIDRTLPLDDAAEALRYVQAGHARGKVVLRVS